MLPQNKTFKIVLLIPALLVTAWVSTEVFGQARGRTGPEAPGRTGAETPGGTGAETPGGTGPGSMEVHHHYYGRGAGYGFGGGAGYGFGMTAAEGAGIGYGAAAAGRGQYNLDTAQAAEIGTQIRGQSIENHNYAVSSYYAHRDLHDKYVAAHKQPGPSQSQMRQNAKIGAPGRLSTAQFDRSTNVIHWPPLLRDPEFTKERETLDQLFDHRTRDDSGAESDNYVEITRATQAMHKTLVEKLRAENLPAVTFIGALHFIKSLAYEGRFAAK